MIKNAVPSKANPMSSWQGFNLAWLGLLLAHPFLTTTSLALIIYLATAAPDLTQAHASGDGGELITASVTLGIPHPTGYPTYILLGKLFSYLPIGAVAYRFHLFSAVATATAAGVVAATASQLLPRTEASRAVAIASGATFATTALVWSQATIAEVYGLNLLAVALFVWSVLGKRPFWQTTLLFGLALTTHATTLLLLPLLLWQPLTQTKRPSLISLLALLLGLSPLLVLPLLAQTASPIVWGNPTTASGWWWLVSGQLYQPNLFGIGWAELAERAAAWSYLLATAFTWLGLPLLMWGVATKLGDKRQRWWEKETAPLLLTAVFTLTHTLGYHTNDAHVLLLPTLLLLTLLLAHGLRPFGHAALLLPLLLLVTQFPQQNLRHAPTLRPEATELLTAVPPNAIVLTPGDNTIFTLWYFHHVEKLRPDVRLVDANLFAFDWYRARLPQTYSDLVATSHDDLAALQQENKRPFCTASLQPTTLRCSEEPNP